MGVARVEWTRLSGDDVEAVVAMCVNRELPDSIRITASQGDGGVDILDRRSRSDGEVVRQIKSYTGPLTAKQKKEVEKSLHALVTDPRWKKLNVCDWHLVTPWDPTSQALNWLDELAERYGLADATWEGLTYVDNLAAKYPEVVDYYLDGGRARVEECTSNSAHSSA